MAVVGRSDAKLRSPAQLVSTPRPVVRAIFWVSGWFSTKV